MPPENKSSEDEEAPFEVSEKVNIIPANTAGKIIIHKDDRIGLDKNTALALLQKTRYRA